MASCITDFEELTPIVPTPDGAIAINMSGSIDQVYTTRANDDGFCDGDGFGLYAVNYENGAPGTLLDKGNQANNVRFVFNENEYKWTPDYPVYYRDNVTPVDLIGYYPYNGVLENVNNYNFEVQQDQSTTDETALMGGYEASDFLWGKVENVQPTDQRINIIFNHMMAGVQVELTEGDGWSEGEWATLKKHILIANTIRKASVDLATGIVTPTATVEVTDITPSINGEYYRAIVVPQSMDASMALLRITIDGTPYLFRKNEAFEYKAGKLHKFTISVSKKEGSGIGFNLVEEEITAWESETISHDGTAREYVIINVPEASDERGVSALKATIEALEKNYAKIQNLKVVGEINANDFYFMRDEMLDLKRVNIEDVTIVASKSFNAYGSERDYEANTIPDQAFNNKTLIERVILPPTLTKIGDKAFAYTRITSMVIPNSVKYIGRVIFDGCYYLISVNIPASLEEIGSLGSTGVVFDDLSLPNTLKKIGASAFSGCRINGKLTLPHSLEELGESAFENCFFSGDLVIPPKIKEIPYRCFYYNYINRLTLPDGLTKIGDQALCGTGELILPNSLREIGSGAFSASPVIYDNRGYSISTQKFTGRLVIPESVMILGGWALSSHEFSGVFEVPKSLSIVPAGIVSGAGVHTIIIHSDVQRLESTAFRTPNLKRIVCLAKIPPVLDGGAFDMIHHDVTFEVPESSLLRYQQAEGWKEMIPSVYRDFELTCEQIKTLNKTIDKKIIVKAPSGVEWSVTHKPDWANVTPSEGVGKVEVTITIDELERNSGNRIDSLVFSLPEHDYHKVAHLEQYDYKYGDGDVIINHSATKGNGVDVVFMADCFDASEIANGYYEQVMNKAIENMFAIEPYKTYKEYFNIYTVIGLSPDSGLPMTYSYNQESCFECQMSGNGSGWNFKFNESKVFEYACKTPTVTKETLNKTTIALILNSDAYAGSTYMYSDNSAIAVMPVTNGVGADGFRGVIQHEVGGHAFGKLADEYIYHNDFIDLCSCNGCGHTQELLDFQSKGWGKNLSLESNYHAVPWSHLIFDPQFSNYVDMYEGGYFHSRGVFRSESNSCMNNNVPYYSAISRQAIVERIMEYAGEEFTYEKFKEKDNAMWGDVLPARTLNVQSFNQPMVLSDMHNKPIIVEDKPVLNF